jgi:penicillin-binding protein 2
MKIARWLNLTLLLLFVAACGRGSGPAALPTAAVNVTHAPSAEAALQAYLDAFRAEDYAGMYALLTQASRDSLSEEEFAGRHTDSLNAMSAQTFESSVLPASAVTHPRAAQVGFRTVYHSPLFGDIQRDLNANLALENGSWRLHWDDSLILPELAGGRHLVVNRAPPARGTIYDRDGTMVAGLQDAYSLGLLSGTMDEETAAALLNRLWQVTRVRPEVIRDSYDAYGQDGLYVPVGEANAATARTSGVLAWESVYQVPYTSRFYEPNVAAHAVGYVQPIFAEELTTYLRLGYNPDESVGRAGIESWGEEYLHGRNAATLYVAKADDTLENVLAMVEAQPPESIYLTIDSELQRGAQEALDGLPGAVVVIEVQTGRVLAMASSPGFDPNWYDPLNYNRRWQPDQPDTFNRATQGQYPLGSVFKIITMAAGLESGLFTPETSYYCGYDYTEIDGVVKHDWTWQRCEDEKRDNGTDVCVGANAQPSGDLTLPEGLMRSCNPWFYHIGYTLYNEGQGTLISDLARGFGLGSPTGIAQAAETEGLIPDPTDGNDATNIATGQGDVLVTPLQAAAFIAAIANGGTLYRPQLVERIQQAEGDPILTFEPQVNGTLPISAENLKVIQDAMRTVVTNTRGTAWARMNGLTIPVAAKTGTAESGTTDPHAWFAGYSLAGRADKPDVAVVVVVNNQGEGSTWAAPIFRRVMEIYFFGRLGPRYLWELDYGQVDPTFGIPVNPTPAP